MSREVFHARLAGSPEGPDYLRTGDLGAVVDGELYVVGRIKEMVIVRGRNHYAQDLEECANAADALFGNDRTIAFSVEGETGEALVLVHEVTRSGLRQLDAGGVGQAVRRALLEALELDLSAIIFVKPASLPRTTSGKLQRGRARQLFLANELSEVARWEGPAGAGLIGAVEADVPAGALREWRAEDVELWLRQQIGAAIGAPPAQVPLDAGFAELGLDSLRAIQLVSQLGETLGVHIDASELYDTPTIADLARRLSGQGAARPARKYGPTQGSEDDRVAIVGMACRFPGAARSAEAFWSLLSGGRSGIGDVLGRWRVSAADEGDAAVRGSVERGGFIEEIDRFDAGFFQIAPVEASKMDPQQRLVLEASWAALEDAGLDPRQLAGTTAGVFLGISTSDYAQILAQLGPGEADLYTGIGSAQSVAAGRVSYVLGLQGPAVAVDTACSSSLVALHQAATALVRGEVDLALTGGVNAILTPDLSLAFARARMLSPDGLCKTFDASADGYVRGEGCGIVVLKRLSDAERDGDRILAVIRGSAVNQDGASAGLTVPNGPAQQRVIGEALERAGVLPHEVDYLEAHGTGTALGDPIEVRAAAAAYGVGRDASHPLLIGSVKTNIGHLEAAAGIAGLIKAVLSLQHGVIPKHLNFVTPSPRIDWSGLPVKVTSEATPLPAGLGRPWRIGVSSFGFSGTNAHVVLESYGPRAVAGGEVQPGGMPAGEMAAVASPRRVRVVALSGKTSGALSTLGQRWGQWLLGRQGDALAETKLRELLSDAAFTAGVGRSHFNHRAAIAFTGPDELASGLAALVGADEVACAEGRVAGVQTGVRNPSAGVARIGFLFTGQGSQWAGMGATLYESEPVFRSVLDRCEAVVLNLRGVSLLDVMFGRDC
ncbi:MAG: beta-ketoacyl synthase N-terminal-like domain-containing protein, partial [Aestuariivirga sp.]|uniref:beta-ketoacyl synthase N-terminal-like domain-containing protein n=1 Tax=Aestuariivirga sp. TaxID=2650926 RepID=UPI003017CE72